MLWAARTIFWSRAGREQAARCNIMSTWDSQPCVPKPAWRAGVAVRKNIPMSTMDPAPRHAPSPRAALCYSPLSFSAGTTDSGAEREGHPVCAGQPLTGHLWSLPRLGREQPALVMDKWMTPPAHAAASARWLTTLHCHSSSALSTLLGEGIGLGNSLCLLSHATCSLLSPCTPHPCKFWQPMSLCSVSTPSLNPALSEPGAGSLCPARALCVPLSHL